MTTSENNEPNERQWFVMRDLKRPNAKLPAYQQLIEDGFEVFTPMRWQIATVGGRRTRQRVPYIADLLFVFASRNDLDPVVDVTPTLQYRFAHGLPYRQPLTVRTDDMKRFIAAVSTSDSPIYYRAEEITPDMYGRTIDIIGGPLNGMRCRLLKMRGTRRRRIIVEIPGDLAAAVEVNPDFIQLVTD